MPHAILSNTVILHIPKCGGQNVLDLLDANDIGYETSSMETEADGILKHLNRAYSSHNIPKTKEYESIPNKMCLLRNPLDWYRSFWAYRMENEGTTLGWRNDVLFDRRCGDYAFTVFIDNVLREYPAGFLRLIYERYMAECNYVGNVVSLFDDVKYFVELCEGLPVKKKLKPTHTTGKKWKQLAQYRDGQAQEIARIERLR
jgi:hypothetical protein